MTIKTIKQKIVILLLFNDLQEHALSLNDNMISKTIEILKIVILLGDLQSMPSTLYEPSAKPLL
jgi:hypothetical protein